MDNLSVESKRIRRKKIPLEPPYLAGEIAKLRGVSPSQVTVVKTFNEQGIEVAPPYPGFNPFCERRVTPRPKIHMEPMNLREELAKIESSCKAARKPPPSCRTSPSIRKELFRPRTTRKSLTGRPSFSTRPNANLFKKTSAAPANKAVATHKASSIRTRKPPNVDASPMAEFLEMEMQCEANAGSSDSDLLTKLAEAVDRDKKLVQVFEQEHSANLRVIDELVKKLRIQSNSQKQSKRIETKQTKGDLRRNVLRRNLEEISEEKGSPRRERGLSLYNSLRNDFVLATPRPDKFGNSSTTTKSFSEKIQEQCLLLQDTPKPK